MKSTQKTLNVHAKVSPNMREPNTTYIPLAHIGAHVGCAAICVAICLGCAAICVGYGRVSDTNMLLSPTRNSCKSFVLQWNIGLNFHNMRGGDLMITIPGTDYGDRKSR